MSTEDGGQAFPVPASNFDLSGNISHPEDGMTLRDYFAAKAMAAFIVNRDRPSEPTSGYFDCTDGFAVADGAYRVAEAMLKARQS